jgi:hypothetical protein
VLSGYRITTIATTLVPPPYCTSQQVALTFSLLSWLPTWLLLVGVAVVVFLGIALNLMKF